MASSYLDIHFTYPAPYLHFVITDTLNSKTNENRFFRSKVGDSSKF